MPPIGDDWRKQTGQRVTNSCRDSEHSRQFTLPPPDEKDAAENPEDLDPDQPVLWDGGEDGAEVFR
jgi:hypothetical protein